MSNTFRGASTRLINNAIFNRLEALAFDIPKGEKGDQGDQGDQGLFGEIGDTGVTGATGPSGVVGELANNFDTAPNATRYSNHSNLFGGISAARASAIEYTYCLAGPSDTFNWSNQRPIQWNQLAFIEITVGSNTRYVPSYWRHD